MCVNVLKVYRKLKMKLKFFEVKCTHGFLISFLIRSLTRNRDKKKWFTTF